MADGSTDFKALLRNKKFQVAAGGVAVVGGLVFYMRSRGGGGTGANTSSPTIPVGSTGYVQGGADTTGTDIAAFLSNYSQSLTAQQNDWAQQWSGNLTDTLQAIKDAAAGGSLTPPVVTPPAPKNKSFTVKAGDNVDKSIQSYLAAGGYVPAGTTAWDWLYKNTGIKNAINWTPGGDHTKNTFKTGGTSVGERLMMPSTSAVAV